MRRKKFFAYVTASTYHVISKEVENQIFKYNYVFINNPLLQKQRSTIFLCKYYLVISDTLVGSFLDVLFLLFGVIFVYYLPLPKWRSCGMAPMKIYFLLWVVFCVISWLNDWKCENLLQFHTTHFFISNVFLFD